MNNEKVREDQKKEVGGSEKQPGEEIPQDKGSSHPKNQIFKG